MVSHILLNIYTQQIEQNQTFNSFWLFLVIRQGFVKGRGGKLSSHRKTGTWTLQNSPKIGTHALSFF